MNLIKNTRLNEEYKTFTHSSGLKVVLYPMPDYSSSYALFSAKYGSVDTTFRVGNEPMQTVPEGIAHYLEHKLFEGEDGEDAFSLFAETGASANAFTSFDKTAYLFYCSQKFEENLRILLNFVRHPYFTDENVQKEQGIIAQEIDMYLDNPEWRVFFNTLCAMYHKNPVRIDIAGTAESISRINKELLYRCYNAFYNLSNMALIVAGNFDPVKVEEICNELLKETNSVKPETEIPDEPYEVVQHEIVKKISCSMPLFAIGFKMPVPADDTLLQEQVRFSVLFDLLFSNTSEFFTETFGKGLINDNFKPELFSGRGYFSPMISGESTNPRKLFGLIKETLSACKEKGLGGFEEDFEVTKKKNYGKLVKILDSVSAVAKEMLTNNFYSFDIYDLIEETAKLTIADLETALSKLDINNSVISIVASDGE
jgi:predicted Zn-dependent peptidase